MTHFIRLITTQHDNTAIANFAATVATNTDTNLYESDDKYSYMDLAEYDTPEGNVVEITLSEELSDDQLDKIVEQITLEDYEIQASLAENPIIKAAVKIGKAAWDKEWGVTMHRGPNYKGADINDAQKKHWETNGENLDIDDAKLVPNEPDKLGDAAAQDTVGYFATQYRKLAAGKRTGSAVKKPILVTPHPDGKGYLVVDGHHRLFGARAAGYKTHNVRVIPREKVRFRHRAPPASQQEKHVYITNDRYSDLSEAVNEKLVVIYPGRFHPFHKGHASVYEGLKNEFGMTADIWIATSDKQEPGRSPFTFEEKREMMAIVRTDDGGRVNLTRVVCCQQPYQATDITDRYDPRNTVVLYAVSEKDMAEDPRFKFPPEGSPSLKKDGQPAHMQKWDTWDKAKPLYFLDDENNPSGHSYVTTVPTIEFNVMGEPATSATEIRQRFPNLSSDQQKTFINDLFGNYSDSVLNIMRNKLGDNNER